MHKQAQASLADLAVHSINSISSLDLLHVEGRLCHFPVRILIDGGSGGNFVSIWLVQDAKLRVGTQMTRTITLADGTQHSASLVPSCALVIAEYHDSFDLLAAPITFDVILGKPWLERFNPEIDWLHNILTFVDSKGKQHTWHAQENNTDDVYPDDFLLSATQLKKRLRDPTIKNCYYCVLTDIEEFNTALDAVMVNQPAYLCEVLQSFPRVFSGVTGMPPARPTDHKIELLPGSSPPFQPIYHMSEKELQLLKTELTRLLTLGHIRRSISPYGAPIFFIEEWMGKIRMVTDYRALNKLTVKNQTALPNILELLDRLRDAQIFTKIDLQSGFHLIRVSEEDVLKTAFRTKYGHYEWTVMPFGLCNAPATFQATMNSIFAKHINDFVGVYIDDLLVYSRTPEEHKIHLQKVLTKMDEHQLCARIPKCRFLQDRVDYLGYVVGNGMIELNEKKTKAMRCA